MFSFSKNLAIILTLTILSACSSNSGDMSVSDGGDQYINGSQGVGNNGGSGDIRSGNLDDLPAGSQEELVATIGDRVFFGFNSAKISAISQQTLSRQAQWLSDNAGVTITIEGHCDERGTREFNLALGEKRATAVKNYLTNYNIDASRIKTISYGKEHPEYLGSTEAVWSKNRRAVTVVD